VVESGLPEPLHAGANPKQRTKSSVKLYVLMFCLLHINLYLKNVKT